jgi:hypothetical protein
MQLSTQSNYHDSSCGNKEKRTITCGHFISFMDIQGSGGGMAMDGCREGQMPQWFLYLRVKLVGCL